MLKAIPKTKLTVIITTHNYGRFLQNSIESVLSQTNQDSWHLIVVDDGSTDDTPDILETFQDDARISVVKLNGIGLAGASNAGIKKAESEWIIRLDADDWFHPQCIEILLEKAEKTGVDLIYGDYFIVEAEGKIVCSHSQIGNMIGAGYESSPLAAGCLFRKDCWRQIGGYDESLRFQEDFDFWLKFTERFKTAYVPQPLMYYRKHSGSMSTNRKPRSEARRQVKHKAACRRRRTIPNEGIQMIVSTIPPLDACISSDLLLAKRGGKNLLDILNEKTIGFPDIIKKVLLTSDEKVDKWAHKNNWDVKKAKFPFSIGNDWFSMVETENDKSLLLVASPLFPLIEKERIQELIDTLLVHDCGRVDSVLPQCGQVFQLTKSGLESGIVQNENQMNGMIEVKKENCLYYQSGGLSIINPKNYSKKDVIGFVEILPFEGFLVREIKDLEWAVSQIN